MTIKPNEITGNIDIYYAPNERHRAAKEVNSFVRTPKGAEGLYYVYKFGLGFYSLRMRVGKLKE